MTILLVGYMMGFGRKLKTLFWYYLLGCGLLGVLLVGTASALTFQNFCGDGTLGGTEECDDGNNTDGDGCDYNCYLEAGTSGSVSPTTGTTTDSETTSPTKTSYRPNEVYKPDTENTVNSLLDIATIFGDVSENKKELSELDDENHNFWGSNTILYSSLYKAIEGQLPSTQRTIIRKVMNGFALFNKQVLETKFNLHRDGIVDFLGIVLDTQIGRNSFSIDRLLNPEESYQATQIQYITPGAYSPNTEKPVVFYLEDQKDVIHLDWQFGNGKTYGCDIHQCSRIPVVYEEPGRYEIRLTKKYRDSSIEVLYETIQVELGNTTDEYSDRTSSRAVSVRNTVYKPKDTGYFVGAPIELIEGNNKALRVYPVNSDRLTSQQYSIFSFISDQYIDHIDRSFGDGQTHGCDRSSCSMIPIIYSEPGTYTVLVTVRYGNGLEERFTSTVYVE